jgi:anti-anti-sigma regulatory factor
MAAKAARAVLVCDVGAAVADAATLHALAALQLLARRRGCRLRLRNPSRELLDLIELAGLSGVFLG